MQILRARPAASILITVLALLLITGVAYAVGRSLGYVPGVGLVELHHRVSLRVLAEPVSQTRDGITVTEVVLSADKTVIVFKVENIPFDKLSHREDVATCADPSEVRLLDGTLLQSTNGGGGGWGEGYESRCSYSFIPADVNKATLLVPGIQDALPGVLPEDWELPYTLSLLCQICNRACEFQDVMIDTRG